MADVSVRAVQDELHALTETFEKADNSMVRLQMLGGEDSALEQLRGTAIEDFAALQQVLNSGVESRLENLESLIIEAAISLTGSRPPETQFQLLDLALDSGDSEGFGDILNWLRRSKVYVGRLLAMEERKMADRERSIQAGGDVIIVNGNQFTIATRGSTAIDRSTIENALNSVVSNAGSDAAVAFARALQMVNDSCNDAAIALMEKIAQEVQKPKSKQNPLTSRWWDGVVKLVGDLAELTSKVLPLFAK